MHEYHYESKVMGSDMAISIITTNERTASTLYKAMLTYALNADLRFSRFIPESELSRLNATRSLKVSDEFMEAFRIGERLCKETDGVFNPLVDISRFGYDQDIEEMRGKDRIGAPEAPYNLAFERIRVEGNTITLAEGQNLDFGGFLKGQVAERLARMASATPGVIVNLGGDLFTLGHDENGDAFEFAVKHPLDESNSLFFQARDRAIATSGSYQRYWLLNGIPFHHLLDKTGSQNPETDLVSATVVASSGSRADAYATAALVLGSREGATFLEKHGCEYCFVRVDGSVISSSELFLRMDTLYSYGIV